jgi:pimeloyl-ACP methyl ester carboxylesterase
MMRQARIAFAAEGAAARSGSGGEEKTYVLVHGAWHGGWCWRPVADALRAQGHRVFTPTQTGLGERRHLLSRDITLDVFVDDIANLMEAEELRDAILVGHSFGGIAISGVADRMPDAVRHLVFLDSIVLQPGQSPFGILPAEVVAARRKLVAEAGGGVAIPPPPPEAFGVPEDHPQAEWLRRRATPHPAGTYESPLRLRNPVGNGRPCTYIACTAPLYAPLEGVREWVRGRSGWRWQEIATGHDAMVTAPAELARMLLAVA